MTTDPRIIHALAADPYDRLERMADALGVQGVHESVANLGKSALKASKKYHSQLRSAAPVPFKSNISPLVGSAPPQAPRRDAAESMHTPREVVDLSAFDVPDPAPSRSSVTASLAQAGFFGGKGYSQAPLTPSRPGVPLPTPSTGSAPRPSFGGVRPSTMPTFSHAPARHQPTPRPMGDTRISFSSAATSHRAVKASGPAPMPQFSSNGQARRHAP